MEVDDGSTVPETDEVEQYNGKSTTVPAAPGSRLQFTWGLSGAELRVIGVTSNETASTSGNEHVQSPALTRVALGKVTSVHQAIAHDTLPLYITLQQARVTGARRDDAYIQKVVAYSNAVKDRLLEERSMADAGLGEESELPCLECALWTLLHVFCVEAPRNDGFLSEDLVAWLHLNHDAIAQATPDAGASLSDQLSDLLNMHIPNLPVGSTASSNPEVLTAHTAFWHTLARLTAVGRTKEALALLEAHPAKLLVPAVAAAVAAGGPGSMGEQDAQNNNQVALVDAMYLALRRMPRLAPSGGLDPTGYAYAAQAEFNVARSAWQSSVVSLQQQLDSSQARLPSTMVDGASLLLRVLKGERQALLSVCQDWMEYMAAQLLHMQPGVSSTSALRPLVASACRAKPPGAAPLPAAAAGGQAPPAVPVGYLQMMSKLLGALCEMDLADIIVTLSAGFRASAWFMAHMTELMYAYPGVLPAAVSSQQQQAGAGRMQGSTARGGGGSSLVQNISRSLLSRVLPREGCDQAELYRLVWADALLAHQGCWRLALEYFAWCPVHGAAAAQLAVTSLNVDWRDTRMLEKVLCACTRLGLSSAAAQVARAVGMAALSAGALGLAASLLLRAGDTARLAAALQPLADAVEQALADQVGSYAFAVLALPGQDELPSLVEHLQDLTTPCTEGACVEAGPSGSTLPVLQLLSGVMALQHALGALHGMLDASVPSGHPDLRKTARRARLALLSLVQQHAAPARLALPLLSQAVPLLELTACPFSPSDVSILMAWLNDSEAALALTLGSGAADGDVVPAVHERYVKDVRLALARALARAHVLQGSVH